jgi:hypothetical protein
MEAKQTLKKSGQKAAGVNNELGVDTFQLIYIYIYIYTGWQASYICQFIFPLQMDLFYNAEICNSQVSQKFPIVFGQRRR